MKSPSGTDLALRAAMKRKAPVLFMAMSAIHCAATSPGAALDAGADGARPAAHSLSEKYPGDVGIDADPALVFREDFEEGSVAAVTARYSNFENAGGMTLVGDRPARSSGHN